MRVFHQENAIASLLQYPGGLSGNRTGTVPGQQILQRERNLQFLFFSRLQQGCFAKSCQPYVRLFRTALLIGGADINLGCIPSLYTAGIGHMYCHMNGIASVQDIGDLPLK